jgi:hypothetical protein
MVREPTVEQIVDRILTLSCGERCDITLNPRITRIDNLKWLLPICVEQFGTRVTIDQHAQAPNVVLTITAAQSRKQIVRERVVGEQLAAAEVRERVVGEQLAAAEVRERVVGEQRVSVDVREPTGVDELEAVAVA